MKTIRPWTITDDRCVYAPYTFPATGDVLINGVFAEWDGRIYDEIEIYELCVCQGCGKVGSQSQAIDCGGSEPLCERVPRPLTITDLRRDLFASIDRNPQATFWLTCEADTKTLDFWVDWPNAGPSVPIAGCESWLSHQAKRKITNIRLGTTPLHTQAEVDAALRWLPSLRDICGGVFLWLKPTEKLCVTTHTGTARDYLGGFMEKVIDAMLLSPTAFSADLVRQAEAAGVLVITLPGEST